MAKYLSGRSKRTPQSGLTSDRYQYLAINQAEPNLGDPTLIYPPLPVGQQYQIVSIPNYPGERYWVPVSGGLIPGSISVYDENYLVGSANSITQLNFVGTAISAIANPLGIAATISFAAPGNNGSVLFKENGDFATSAGLVFNSSVGILTVGTGLVVGTGGTFFNVKSNGLIGIGTTNPTQELDINGDLRLRGTIYDYNNQPGTNQQILVKNNFGGVSWINQQTLTAGAGGTITNIQYHNDAGLVDGAANFVFDFTNSRVGVGSTQPGYLLDVLGYSRFKGQTDIDYLKVTGVATVGFATITDSYLGVTTIRYANITNSNTGIATVGLITATNAYIGVATVGFATITNSYLGVTTVGFITARNGYIGILTVGDINIDRTNLINLNVTGIATIATLGVTGLTTTRYLNVVGVTTTDSLNVVGLTSTKDLKVTGIATFENQVTINNLNVTGVGTFDNIKLFDNTVATTTGNLILDSTLGTTQINDILYVNDTTQSTNKDNGSIYTEGGVGIEKNLNVGGASSIAGITTFGNNVLPYNNGTQDLGSLNQKWNTLYVNTVNGNIIGYASSIAVSLDSSNTSRYIPFVDVTAGLTTVRTDDLLVWNPSTNSLGIGTTNPKANLQISGGKILLDNNTSSTASNVSENYIGFGTNGISRITGRDDTTSSAFLAFLPAGNEAARFDRSGNLGIGTTNPTEKLDVNGNIRLRSALKDFYGNVGAAASVLISTGAGVSWTTPFAAGLQGLQGVQGIQGIQGTTGTQGTQGIQGTTGRQGTQGIQGTTGTATQGTQGIQGTTGTQGRQGIQGTTGTQGTQGIQGSAGTGTQGTQGIQGTTGTQGIQGTTGTQGIQGRQGIQGTSGTGTQGTQGIQGTTGTQGIQGTTGTGTQGTQGIQGTTGTQGTQGIQGITGTQGISGDIGGTGLSGTGQWTPNVTGGVTIVNGNTFTKSSGTNLWDGSQVYSTEGYTRGVYATAQVTSIVDVMFGLNSDPVTNGNPNYITLDYAWYFAGDGNVYIFENGNNIGGSLGVYSPSSTVLNITYDGYNVRYWKDGNIQRTVARSIGNPLYLDSSFYTVGATLTSVGFGPMGEQGTQGIQGTSGTGTQGIQGITGTGIQGTQGIQGTSGSSGPSTTINATDDISTTTLYPVMVGDTGSNQTAKARSTATALKFNASTNVLSAANFEAPGDGSTLYGPNTGWSQYLRVGGNGNTDTTNASVVTTNGNLHLDAKTGGFATYLNFYKGTGGINFGNGAGSIVGSINSSGDLALEGLITTKRGINDTTGTSSALRIELPGGAAYATSTNVVTGAIKIRLPVLKSSANTMLMMRVKVYNYDGDAVGTSRIFEIGGYPYAPGNWYNVFACQTSMSTVTALNVRYGYDAAGYTCVWIGETNTTWNYPQVFVTEFEAGYSNYSATTWASNWAITFETSFNTVEKGPITASLSSAAATNVSVVQTGYNCTAPITTNSGTITIGTASNAYGRKFISPTEPTSVCDGDIWFDTSGGSGTSALSAVGAANQILYKNASNIATGSGNLTFDGNNLTANGVNLGIVATGFYGDPTNSAVRVPNAGGGLYIQSPSGAATWALINSSNSIFYNNFYMNSGYGSAAIAYGCRAWVNFDGTGAVSTNQTMRGSGNVFSVFKNAVGNYTVNFNNPMPDENYAAVTGTRRDSGTFANWAVLPTTYIASSLVVNVMPGGSNVLVDSTYVNVAIFR
jgi:hypothetical protein